jgi:putative sigma-54 modulation protein
MEFSIKSRNTELTGELKDYIARKLGHFDRKLENIMEIRVEVFEERTRSALDRHVVTVNINGANILFHAEERGETILTAVDKVAESVIKQIERQKGKWQDKGKAATIRIPESLSAEPPKTVEKNPVDSTNRIVEVRTMGMKPMSLAEAQDQIDVLGYDFLLFLNTDTQKVNLLMRRPDGKFSLVVPGP